jgi:hypothetical protein
MILNNRLAELITIKLKMNYFNYKKIMKMKNNC